MHSYPITTRREAYAQGSTRYFTGVPCKQGHVAQRYVSSGACLDCQRPFVLRRHPTLKSMQPYVCPKLWVPTGVTPEQYTALETYLQTCIDTFFAHAKATAHE